MAGRGAGGGQELVGERAKGSDTCGLHPWEGGGLWRQPLVSTQQATLREGWCPALHHIPTLGHCLHHPTPPARGHRSSPVCQGRKELAVSPSGTVPGGLV